MKKIFYSIIILGFMASMIIAQGRGRDMKPLQRLQQFEKLKIIEVLGLNEEAAVRFFARRHDNQLKMKEILDQRDKIIQDLEDAIRNGAPVSDVEYKDQLNNLLGIEANITKERENFLRSLGDLLTPQQIAKLVVFETRFRNEVRSTLMERGKPPMKD